MKRVSARPTGVGDGMMSASNMLADRDEDFNTRLGSTRGWQMAIERVIPIPRATAQIDLVGQLRTAGVESPAQVIDWWEKNFFNVPLAPADKTYLTERLVQALGTEDLHAAWSYAEAPLRRVLHEMLSLSEYQLG